MEGEGIDRRLDYLSPPQILYCSAAFMPFQTNATIGAYGGGRAEVRRRKGVLTPRSNTFRGLWVHKCTTKMVRGGGHANSISAAAAPAASASSFFTVQTSYMVIAR